MHSLAMNDTYLFAGIYGGVLRSSDRGLTWTELSAGQSFFQSDCAVVACLVALPFTDNSSKPEIC